MFDKSIFFNPVKFRLFTAVLFSFIKRHTCVREASTRKQATVEFHKKRRF